jgi:Na+/proline symporter
MRQKITWSIILALFLFGPALVVISIVFWLRDGIWAPIENTWLLRQNPEFDAWLANPTSWLGAHKLIKGAMAGLPLGMVSWIFAYWLMMWDTEMDNQERAERDRRN